MKIKNFRFVMLIILGIIFLSSIVVQAEGGTQAEQIIQSFMAEKGMNIQSGTREYKLFMRAILWGEYPELRESDSAFIQHPDEVKYIRDYAWKHSEYEKFHGGYIEMEIEELEIEVLSQQKINRNYPTGTNYEIVSQFQ